MIHPVSRTTRFANIFHTDLVLLFIQVNFNAGIVTACSLHVDDRLDEIVHFDSFGNELQELDSKHNLSCFSLSLSISKS